jgi:hypothetical protein
MVGYCTCRLERVWLWTQAGVPSSGLLLYENYELKSKNRGFSRPGQVFSIQIRLELIPILQSS